MDIEFLKSKLMTLDDDIEDFLLIFTGKESKKVNGLYKPENKEILIHNRNFKDPNGIIYTAIHELAHHIHHTKNGPLTTTRSHSSAYWEILHKLLKEAERTNFYINPYKNDKEFDRLTKKIKKNFLYSNGELMKELGAHLKEAYDLCLTNNLSFDDYVDRELNIHRNTARMLMKIFELDISPELGYENMKLVSQIKDETLRDEAETAFVNGESPDTVKGIITREKEKEEKKDPIERLIKEKSKIEKTISNLQSKLQNIEKMLSEQEGF